MALKATQHFRAGFSHLAGTIIRCDPPGITTSDLTQLPYQRVRRPIWPLDDAPDPDLLSIPEARSG